MTDAGHAAGVRPAALPGLHARGTSLWDRTWRPFWALPTALIVASALLGLGLPLVDTVDLPLVFSGGPDSARTVLSSIVGGMIPLTGLVFSITIVLRAAGDQPDPAEVLVDGDGDPRVTYRPWTFERMLGLAVEEIARYGETSPRVQRALRGLLTAIETDVRVEHVPAVRGWRERIGHTHDRDAGDTTDDTDDDTDDDRDEGRDA